ncbi:MAG TPA: pitrilysin family protein [Gemmatimonadales bacterium]|nr:pitrilysin family protein [Gemmatimonadales bacterium]
MRGPTVEGITEYGLPNGLKVLLFPDSSKPTITVNITYLVGSRYEGYGETGMAHLLEHMVFKGSPRHRDIPQELTEHGAQPNGTTSFDRTNYFETFAATDSNLVWALDLEADRMVNSFIAEKDFKTEFTVVRNEFEMGENSPFNILFERTMETAYLWHNYGHPTIGARSDIENVPIGRLQAFYHKYYQPDNAVLLVAGKIDPERTLQLVEQKFGAIPRPERTGAMKIYPTYTAEPTQDGERSVTLRRVGDVQAVMAAYHVPAGSDSDFPAVEVLSDVLGSAPSGRLYKALVETKKAASVGAFAYQLREPGVLVAFANVREEDSLDSARTTMLATIDSMITTPATPEEVDRAKASLLKNIELNLNNSTRIGLELSEWVSMGDWRMLFLYRDRLKTVTPAEVQRVAARYLVPSNRTVGEFIPTKEPLRAEIPPTPDVAALVKDYKGDTTRSAGEAFDPSPANIEARTTRTTLPGGIKLALLPKRTRGATVHAMLSLRFGTPQAIAGKNTIADLTADMLMRGSTLHTRQQIKDSLDKLEARVNVFGGPNTLRVTIETTRPNLIPTLALVREVLRMPAFDTSEFRQLQQANLAQIEQQKSEPTALASVAYGRYMHPYPKDDPRYTPTFAEQAAAYGSATVEDARTFYRTFYGASNGEMAVVGDFDPAAVTAEVTSMLGDWKSPGPFARVTQEYQDRPDTTIVIETPDKANAMFLAGMNLPLRDDSPDYAALLLGNYMLGGGFLNSRLAVRIRQKEGISYGVGSFLGASALDESGQFTTYAIYAPQNATRLEEAFEEEVARVLKDGFTGEEVQQAKDGWLQSREVNRSQDQGLANELTSDLYYGRTLDYDAQLEKQVAALTPAAINAAMRKYLDPSKFTIIEAGDFAKAKAKQD